MDAEITPEENTVNVVNPEGKLVAIPSGSLNKALRTGYQPATAEDENLYQRHEEYGSVPQQVLTGVEGALSTVTGGLSTAFETALDKTGQFRGVFAPEAVRERREENPGSHGIGSATGIVGGAMSGLGAVGAIEGAAGAIAGRAAASGLGQAAIRSAVSAALIQGEDEVSKMFSEDPAYANPQAAVQMAVSNMGMAAVLGGGLGGGFNLAGKAAEGVYSGAEKAISKLVGEGQGKVLELIKSGKLGNQIEESVDKAGLLKYVFPRTTMMAKDAAGLLNKLSTALGSSEKATEIGLGKIAGLEGVTPQAFKSMVKFIQQTVKGENLLSATAKDVFRSGAPALASTAVPSARDITKLDDLLKKYQQDPEALFALTENSAHDYLPDHGVAMGEATANAVNYLNSMRPTPVKQSPLDAESEVDKTQKSAFERALTVAQQPLMTLDYMKKGEMLPQDITVMKTLYPAVYQRASQKLMDGILKSVNKGETIPYNVRLGLSQFLGQPLDSTMLPSSIQAAQVRVMPRQADQNERSVKPSATGMKGLSKVPQMAMTNTQARLATKYK